MRVFVTGIAGFLGSHLASGALERGWQVSGIDSMLGGDEDNVPAGTDWLAADCRSRAYSQLLSGADVVFHAAAAPYEGLSVFSPEIVYENTLMATVSTLRASVAAGVKRFVFCSSMSRYGAQETPFTEDMTPSPADPYGCAKAAAEAAVRCIGGLHGMEWVIAVPHNVYGPRQRYTDPYRNVAAIMINRALQGRPPVIYGDGSQRRSFSHVDDVAPVMLDMATAPVAGEVFNVGPDDAGITIAELASLVLKATDPGLVPVHYDARPAEVHTATCSAAKARRVLGYQPQVPLEDGIAELTAWIRQRGPRPFDYHLPVELPGETTPRTWTEHLM
jgi:UDP-glucose 4-epimerase